MKCWWTACLLIALCTGCTGPDRLVPAQTPLSQELAARRSSIAAEADRLAASGVGAPAALAHIVQLTADRAVAYLGPDAARRAWIRLTLDDSVDLVLGPSRPIVQHALMTSPPAYDGPPIHESSFDSDSFRVELRPGEGRFRHFILAAAATYVFPPLWVEVVARWVGGDVFPAAGTDSAADVAANAAGRDFGLWLRTVDPAVFADGESVERWIRERLEETVP